VLALQFGRIRLRVIPRPSNGGRFSSGSNPAHRIVRQAVGSTRIRPCLTKPSVSRLVHRMDWHIQARRLHDFEVDESALQIRRKDAADLLDHGLTISPARLRRPFRLAAHRIKQDASRGHIIDRPWKQASLYRQSSARLQTSANRFNHRPHLSRSTGADRVNGEDRQPCLAMVTQSRLDLIGPEIHETLKHFPAHGTIKLRG